MNTLLGYGHNREHAQKRGRAGIEPATSRTQSENHTTRPTAHSIAAKHARRDSNPQPPDSKSDALSVAPRAPVHTWNVKQAQFHRPVLNQKMNTDKCKSVTKTRQQRDSNSRGIASNWFLINRLNHSAMLPWSVVPRWLASQRIQFILNWKKKSCAGRESNPGLVRGRDVYYHCTTGADNFAASNISTQYENICVSTSELTWKFIMGGSYGAMAARWIPDPKVGGSNPSSFTFLLFFFCRVTDDDILKLKTKCRNWESHPGCRGHNAESCY